MGGIPWGTFPGPLQNPFSCLGSSGSNPTSTEHHSDRGRRQQGSDTLRSTRLRASGFLPDSQGFAVLAIPLIKELIAKAVIMEHGLSARTARRTSTSRRTTGKLDGCESSSKPVLQGLFTHGWPGVVPVSLGSFDGRSPHQLLQQAPHTLRQGNFIVEGLIMD